MEKGIIGEPGKIIRVALTGPECTGKSVLAEQLAAHYHTVFVPEYARNYVAELGRQYTYEDVVHIAETQKAQALSCAAKADRILFLDTYLIITKIWFEVVFGRYPEWIDNELSNKTIDLYLLCEPDIPWMADPVRENGGEMREKLFVMYRQQLDRFGLNYTLINGTGRLRTENAIKAVDQHLQKFSVNL
jgi:NadR type nicotinamide-nucleotide adenylyltransferase